MLRRLPVVALVFVALVGLGFGVWQMADARQLRAAASDAEAKRLQLQRRLAELERANIELAGHMGRRDKSATPAPSAETASAEKPPENGPSETEDSRREDARSRGERMRAFMATPEAQQLVSMVARGALDAKYADLFRQMRLSPEELERFKQLLLEKQNTVRDVYSAARENGLRGRENRDEIRALIEQSQAEVDESIKSEMGDARFAQYRQYESSLSQRAVVDQLAKTLSYSSAPLSAQQGDQLVAILAANPSQNSGGGNAEGGRNGFFVSPGGGLSASTPITNAAIKEAQSFLSATQVNALRELQVVQQAQRELSTQMRDASRRPSTQ